MLADRVGGFDNPLLTNALACPQCGLSLRSTESQLACPSGHSFNIARQGYASLLGGGRRPTTGDSASMVAARVAFLGTGQYRRIADAVSRAVPPGARGVCLDVAGGTGYYLAAVLDEHPGLFGLALDLSPFAARRAAKAHPRAVAVTADAWQALPLQTGSVNCILNVFGPRNGSEMRRVLAADGLLVVVTPTERHLQELREPLGMIGVDPRKQDRLDIQLADFAKTSETAVEYVVPLSAADVSNEVLMGPSAHHIGPEQLESGIRSLPDPLDVTVSVTVGCYRPIAPPPG